MQYSDYFMFFGFVSIVLGVLGWVRAKSVASLYAGGLSGIALAASAFMAARRTKAYPDDVNYGYVVCLVVNVLLLGRFLPGFLKSKKIYPSGIMAVLSLLGVAAGVLALMKAGPLK